MSSWRATGANTARWVSLVCLLASGSVAASVVVTEVGEGYAAAHAGVEPGDRIEAWRRDAHAGDIDSPFDLLEVAIHQSDLGAVTLSGVRDGQQLEWPLTPGVWVLGARPDFDEQTLARFEALRSCDDSAPNAVDDVESLASSLEPTSTLDAAWIWQWWARSCLSARSFDAADAATETAVEKAEASGRPDVAAQIIETTGRTLGNAGRMQAAMDYLSDAAARRALLEPEGLALAADLRNMAIAHSAMGKLEQAEAVAGRALLIQRARAPGSLAVAETLHTIGNAHF